jgi:hypothetical protein
MLTKTKIVLAAVIVLGAGSLAQASNENGMNETGGYVLPPNLDGVNPVYHPRWFPQYGRVMRAYDRANTAIYSGAGAGAYAFYPSANSAYGFSANSAYGFVPSATHHKHRSRH